MTDRLRGRGLLRDAVARRLGGPDGAWPPILVCLADGWDRTEATALRRKGHAVLGVHVELGTAVIGPVERSGRPGCGQCAARRQAILRGPAWQAAMQRHAAALARPSSRVTACAAAAVAHAVARELRILPDREIVRIDMATLDTTRHTFLPVPGCPCCGGPEPPGPLDLAAPGTGPGTGTGLRARPVPAGLDESYVDPHYGLVGEVAQATQSGAVVSTATAGTVIGFGRAVEHRSSRAAAVLEALERAAGARPRAGLPVVEASLHELGDTALDPRLLGLDGAGRARFHDGLRLRWVWAHSLRRDAPVLVPETCAYYGVRRGRLGAQTSSGCAIGADGMEAVVHGMLEVAERDAFLLTWYGRIPAPAIEIGAAADPVVRALAGRIGADTGWQLHARDIAVEQGVPVVLVLAVNPDTDPSRPKVVCAAGAHLTRQAALRAALLELAPVTAHQHYRFRAGAAAAMAADSTQVTSMADHVTANAHVSAQPRFDFLFDTAAPARPVAPPPADLRAAFDLLTARYLATCHDVVVVDQTAPEHLAAGLTQVKILIPGALPMTFGHANRRIHGLPRLLEMPRILGHRALPMIPAEINPYPHPFP